MRFARFLAVLVLAASLPANLSAQCGDYGTAVGSNCFGLDTTGCCADSAVYWCESGTLCTIDCTQNLDPTCGWSGEAGFYDCGQTGAGYDSAQGVCPVQLGGTGPDEGGWGTPSGGCGSIPAQGCCDGSTLKMCYFDEVMDIDCSFGFGVCGWDYLFEEYSCSTDGGADPSGTFPKVCSGGSTGPDCTPSCFGKACGADGCGGQCGYCGAGEYCSGGSCVSSTGCQPNCAGMQCGNNGCGGQCGYCDAGQACVSGTCQSGEQCVPNCLGKECGTNGCGGMCGACGSGKACDANGACVDPAQVGCVPACAGKECGHDGCGGTCGSCKEGYGCTQNVCVYGMECQPDCAGRECGPDGCDGQCGLCAAGSSCDASGHCAVGGGPTGNGDGQAESPCPAGQSMYYGVCLPEPGDNAAQTIIPLGEADGGGANGACGVASRGWAGGGPMVLTVLLVFALLGLKRRTRAGR